MRWDAFCVSNSLATPFPGHICTRHFHHPSSAFRHRFSPLFSSSKSSRPIDERKNDEKRTLACACVFTTRLGATFFRLKELVEPAVDLAKEIDCMEAAIFMRVFRAFLCGLRARARIFSFSPFGDGAVFFLVFFLFVAFILSSFSRIFFAPFEGEIFLFSEF